MPRPLTKITTAGRVYEREPAIEKAIDALAGLAAAALVERARSSSVASVEYVPSECLVYFIREAWQRRDKVTMTGLIGVLFVRCEDILKHKIKDRDMPNAADVRANILGELSLLFVQGDTEVLDYYECHFNSAFRALRIDHVRKEFAAINRLTSEEVGFGESALVDKDIIERVSSILANTSASQLEPDESGPEDIFFRREVIKALYALPEDECNAFVLVHGFGYKEESNDPEEATAATRCGVTGRTIRNRLERAKAKLSRLKEEK